MSSLSLLKQNRLTVEMVSSYLLFSFLIPIGQVLKPFFGEVADVLQMAGYFWPYPVFLALQSWPGVHQLWPLIIAAGLLLVLGFAILLQRCFTAFSQPKPWAHVAGFVLWYVPVLFAQGLLVLVVWFMGYPVGE
jgi:hypothetical protein